MPAKTSDSPSNGNGNGSRKYRNDPIAFVRDHIAGSGLPYAKQEELLRAAAERRRVSVVGCNGSGKDWTVARIVLWWIATRKRAKAIITGPTQRQVEEVVWRELRFAFAGAEPSLPGQVYTNRYVVGDERFALGFATDHAYNLQGFHSPNLLVVVTEAHAVEQQHMDALKRLNPKLLLLSGNPLTLTGEFFDSHHGKRHLYETITISAFDTPNVANGTNEVPGMLTLEDVEEREREWGKESPLYKAAVLGEFPDSLEDTLLTMRVIEKAVQRWQHTASEAGEPWHMGVDVARFGADKSVLCLRRGGRIEHMHQLFEADTMQVTGRVIDYAHKHPFKAIFVDAAGVGGGVVDRLREQGLPVVEVQPGASSSDPRRFLNLRAELFWELRKRFLTDDIAIPNDAELIGQLLAIRYDFTSAGQVKIEGKPEMRRRGLPSPDKADALALAFMETPSLEVWV